MKRNTFNVATQTECDNTQMELREYFNYCNRQDNLKNILNSTMTMENWDILTVILQEHSLHSVLDQIYSEIKHSPNITPAIFKAAQE